MRRALVFATELLDPLAELSRAAEDAGFARVWTTEYAGRDAVARAQHLAAQTSSIAVGTGIAYAFTRAPLALAGTAGDAYVLSGGRFDLGLGAGTRGMRERFFGIRDFDHPAPRLAEYIALLRAAWAATDGLNFEGTYYRAAIPHYRSGHDPAALAGLQVIGSGLNATMLRYAAASCDQVALHPMALASHYLRDVVGPSVAAGAARADRPAPPLVGWVLVSLDADAAVARRRARQALAFYFSTPSYGTVAEGTSWAGAVAAIRAGFTTAGADWDALGNLVPDEMVDELSCAGTPEQVAEQLAAMEKRLAGYGATEIALQTVGMGLPDAEVVDNLRAIIRDCAPA